MSEPKKVTKASLLKQIKQLNRYEKKYFSYTTVALLEVLEQIKNERVVIKEPIFEDEEEEKEEPEPEKVKEVEVIQKVKVEKPKKNILKTVEAILPQVIKQKKVEPTPKLKRVLFKDDEYKKQIQKIMKDLDIDITDLLKDFDDEDNLTEDDSNTIKNEYNEILDKAYDSIEIILEKQPSDLNYHKIIERKIKLIDEKVKAFLIN